jgi:OOP family OmpA-OmpF porin
MKDNPEYKLDIHGHTDSQGDDAKNMILSKDRAASVKAYLVAKGIEAGRMDTEGFGETEPKATNDTPTGRAENRRVEFKVKF